MSAQANPRAINTLGHRNPFGERGMESGSRKASRVKYNVPVPNPTQVDRCESTKAYERNIVRELGKTAAVTSG